MKGKVPFKHIMIKEMFVYRDKEYRKWSSDMAWSAVTGEEIKFNPSDMVTPTTLSSMLNQRQDFI